jgi:DNA polymerase-3 subunit delta'
MPAEPALALDHQPRAQLALNAALAGEPSHAYLFRGPRGAGKRAAARAFAAEIIAAAAPDPEDARRRVMLDPSPHPDLVWLSPRGAQHMVEDVREQVIRAAAYRPFEGGRRVFVVEAAEAMRDESQNALLKTLEEPPPFVHLLLLSSEPEALLETVGSRCQAIDFAPLPVDAIEAALAAESGHEAPSAEERAAAARLCGGDVERARFLVSARGRELRAEAEGLVSAALEADGAHAPWGLLLKGAEGAGEEAETATRAALEEEAAAGRKRSARELTDEAKRAARRRRTEVLVLALDLCASWLRDLAATAAGATEAVFNRDRAAELARQAESLDAAQPRRAAEAVADTRRRLDLNVSEELALEALFYRARRELAAPAR